MATPSRRCAGPARARRKLAEELTGQGHPVSHQTVGRLLTAAGYSLQANRKTREGGVAPGPRTPSSSTSTPRSSAFQRRGQPVISVDTKKKELVGDFKNGGREWQPEGEPEEVRVHDFIDKELGKAIPYGVYDLTANQGWVSVGHRPRHGRVRRGGDPALVAEDGREALSRGRTELLITADGGGSNGSRCRLWKVALQELADETGPDGSTVCHFPPGTSKWNKIEHRLFCHITQNWRGRPLVSHEVIVNLIGSTTTEAGLTIQAELDTRQLRDRDQGE